MRRPNIIYFFSDEQIYSAFNMVNKDVYTPNLNRLASMGMTFNQCVSNCPVCVPYRNILVNGRMVRDDLVVSNYPNQAYTNKYESYASILKRNGYKTAYVGKLHLNDNGYNGADAIKNNLTYGYDYWQQTTGEDCINVSYYDFNSAQDKIYEGYAPTGQMNDALGYIRQNSKESSPFLLTLSIFPPHAVERNGRYLNTDAPEKWVDYYKDKEITFRAGVSKEFQTPEAADDIRQYYAHCSAIDEELGRLIDTLEQEGILDNTSIIYSSDHGDMLWTHGRSSGKGMPYEEAIRVPLIVAYKNEVKESAVSNALISAIDMAPSILGLAGIEKPDYMDGIDFSDLFRGEEINTPDAVYILAAEGGVQNKWNGLRTNQYTYSEGYYEFLFDNLEDPSQLKNLFYDSSYSDLKSKLHLKLQEFKEKYGA
jgi:arylsulfatase A-like enzyme